MHELTLDESRSHIQRHRRAAACHSLIFMAGVGVGFVACQPSGESIFNFSNIAFILTATVIFSLTQFQWSHKNSQ